MSAQLIQSIGLCIPDIGKFRINLEGAITALEGFVVSAQIAEGIALIYQEAWFRRFDLKASS